MAAIRCSASRSSLVRVNGFPCVLQMPGPESIVLADLTWVQAARVLRPSAVVLLPLGAAAKEHGPHLRLDNDLRLAQALTERVMCRTAVVVAPPLLYHHYPAFADYPGSTSLRFETARDLVVDVVRSLAMHGPKRFYVLNTGLSTGEPLAAAAQCVFEDGILLHFTDITRAATAVENKVCEQQRGSHADEGETSMMLCLAPERVDMSAAVRDDAPRNGQGGFNREPGRPGVYSRSGVWGDATLADPMKGTRLVEATVDGVVHDIDLLRDASLPGAGR
jgi:creatinine amidohydrolase